MDEAAERRRLIEIAKATGNRAFLRAAAQLRKDGDALDEADSSNGFLDLPPLQPQAHRPEINDLGPLLEMARLKALGLAKTTYNAAKQVAQQMQGQHSESATTERLRKKMAKYDDFGDVVKFFQLLHVALNEEKYPDDVLKPLATNHSETVEWILGLRRELGKTRRT